MMNIMDIDDENNSYGRRSGLVDVNLKKIKRRISVDYSFSFLFFYFLLHALFTIMRWNG